jgi:hypothetical protein
MSKVSYSVIFLLDLSESKSIHLLGKQSFPYLMKGKVVEGLLNGKLLHKLAISLSYYNFMFLIALLSKDPNFRSFN